MIEFTTGLLMLASAFSNSTSTATSTAIVQETIATTTVATTTLAIPNRRLTIAETESIVRAYFEDTPILAEIARCESEFRQHDGKTGEVLRGKVDNGDIGVMQINKRYHEEDAVKLGIDIYTLQGNLDFAKILYGKYGSKPWKASSPCWIPRIDMSHIAIAK